MVSKKKKIKNNKKVVKAVKKFQKVKEKLSFEKKTKIDKPYPEDFGVFEFGWEKRPKIVKPKKSIFKPKVFSWEIRKKIAKPRRSDFIFHHLNWKIPWLDNLLHPNKIDPPKKEDFEEEKEVNIIVGESNTIKASTLFKNEKETKEKYLKEKEFDEPLQEKKDFHGGLILFLVGITYITWIGMLIGRYFLGLSIADYLILNAVFLDLAIISIIVAAIYSVRKNIFYGFAYISIIVILYIALSFLFIETLLNTITILLIVLAILPIEIYLVFYTKK